MIRKITEPVLVFLMLGLLFYGLVYKPRHIDPELRYYTAFFANKVGKRGDIGKYRIIFMSQYSQNVAGSCNYLTNTIEVNPNSWYNYERTSKERINLLFHELGHCMCGLQHDDSTRDDNCPDNLMFPALITKKCLDKYFHEYTKDLYGKCK